MELNVYIGQKIKDFRKLAGMTQTDLAQRLETTKQTISRYEKGDRKPGQDTLFELTDIFKVSIDDFFPPTIPTTTPDSLIEQISDKVVQLHQDRQKNVLSYATEQLDEQERASTISDKTIDLYDARKRISLPVPGKVSAGTGYWQEDDYDTMVSFYADDIPDQKDFDTIAIAVGHSMEPKIKNGDFLFIKFTPTVDLNKIGIFQVDGENYVKKLKSDCLESLNPDYDNIQFTEDMRTIGEVVEVYRER
ncbi:TPA: helix-turn-helix transcriptional regulator [Streptococcus suis]|uniref:XRE family transcriptional regulator n=1 Tax=Streptococcus suis TaxID=1307 RepID=UPI002118B6C1|nr:XRE family transcriptional regulator [Streptococcus suis]MCQ8270959.1 XRE family transcriptional regulator [Streptococcus suis]MDW8720710.1 XRE family transcriptional regulator [Streptococcus suis]HEL1641949.1 helix-turn-helix transcriptional regulator [Streptococcus suis]HEL1650742.1 helix-turn-helix transcriptional regulator [Streptococcus suis]HEL2242451.1 helix-turn-helix transcriptional regulator [Streptococcus suis]